MVLAQITVSWSPNNKFLIKFEELREKSTKEQTGANNFAFQYYLFTGDWHVHLWLNTDMAATCSSMIKIVKVSHTFI